MRFPLIFFISLLHFLPLLILCCPLLSITQSWHQLRSTNTSDVLSYNMFTAPLPSAHADSLAPSSPDDSSSYLNYRIGSRLFSQPLERATNNEQSNQLTTVVQVPSGALIHAFASYSVGSSSCDTPVQRVELSPHDSALTLFEPLMINHNEINQNDNIQQRTSNSLSSLISSSSPTVESPGVLEMSAGTVSAVCPNTEFTQRLRHSPISSSSSGSTSEHSSSFYSLDFVSSSSNVDWVDLHYKINDGQLKNVRLFTSDTQQDPRLQTNNNFSSSHFPLFLSPSDHLSYFLTTKLTGQRFACNSPLYSMLVSEIQG
jgi:hypothetical protein